uniref:DUF3730 domain-containing protein n=1 Tax=Electrophorus electricus TaxID=8005 RepID=A0A4W4GAP8_ELEEL
MNEALKKRFEFPSSLIQAQVNCFGDVCVCALALVHNVRCGWAWQGPALDALWEQCDSESGVVRSACCSALVLLVEQGHADLQHVLNSILNMLPSARSVQGLIKVVGRLLQIQASQRDRRSHFTCPYSIRMCPHPYITVLENRPDCWPALLQEIDDFIHSEGENESLYISMLAPFLRYLYCEPQRLPENALLRYGLLHVLLHPRDPAPLGNTLRHTPVAHEILCCLVHLFPHMTLSSLAESLTAALLGDPERWKAELAQLAVQILCACQLSLQLGGELRSLLHTLHQLLPACREVSYAHGLHLGRMGATESNVLDCAFFSRFRLVCPSPPQKPTQLALPLSPWYSELQAASAVLHRLSAHPTASAEWLHSVRSVLPSCERLPDTLLLLVSHLIASSDGDLCRLALNTAAGLAEADPAQVPCLLPVLLFKLDRASDPVLCHAVLSTIPKLAKHKFCIPQVLRVLQTLAGSPKLRAVALRLLTALWQKQDRVYAEVQKLMTVVEKSSVVVGKEAQWEQVVARGACIRDICRERPYQHGGDMLAAITATLAQCSRGDQATPAALALQGLQELCRAEVVDIGSTWKALSPRLSCETRPLVLKATAELLSLVPSLHVRTEQYENFKSEVVSVLWSHALSQDAVVASSGYRALSEFPESSHSVLHLPEHVRLHRLCPGDLFCHRYCERKEPDPQDDEENEQDEDLTVPGASYVKLVGLTPRPVLPALETFLTALVRQEMSQMPRGVYHSALRGGNLRSDQGKTVAGIPAFMLKTYEKNKQPGLKPGLAAGLLLCYDLPVQTDRDGRPISRFMVSRGRSFQQMLTTFIHEVNIQPSEWHRSLLLPQAWRGFMSRAYHAVLQGRNAELEMLQKQGKASPDELQYKQHCAGPEVLPTAHWLSTVIDTLLSIVSSNSRPRGQVFPWFVHRSYSGENTASAIARSCAALGLALLAPVLVTTHREAVPTVLDVLRAGLPSAPAADDSQALQFHSGLALGMLLARLLEERVSDIGGQSMWELVLSSLEQLEACCFSTQLEYKYVPNTSPAVLAYSVACAGVSAFSSGTIDGDRAEGVMSTLRSMTEESQQTPGFSLALGLFVHGLSSCGHGKAEDLHPRLLSAWTKIVLAEGCPTMQRLAALNGLIALVGSEAVLFQVAHDTTSPGCSILKCAFCFHFVSPAVATQIISFSGAIGLQSNGACLVGHLYLAHMSSSHSRTAVPQDFSYLPEKSIIRASTECLIEAGRKGVAILMKVVLAPLATVGSSFQYPPVNWNAILSPLMRLNFGEEVQHHCLELAVSQVQSSPNASLFLGAWLAPPLVHSLSLHTKALLYERLCSWMKHVAEDKLQVYMESLAVQQFLPGTRAQRMPLCLAVLRGLASAMALPDPARTCWATLCSSTEKIFNLLPDNIQADEVELYEGICSCLSEMSDTEIDRVVRVTEANLEKTAFILSYFSSKGRIPLLGLNDVISTVLLGSQSGKREQISWLLLQCFYQSRLASSPNTGVSKRMEWLLELMGHIRNVAYCAPTGTEFLLGVFAAALASWADHSMPLLVGARAQWFPWRQSPMEHLDPPHGLYMTAAIAEESLKQCLLGMPHSLKQLLTKEPWKAQSQKFTDWLFSLVESNLFKEPFLLCSAALLALRSTPEFKKKAVWTRAYGW